MKNFSASLALGAVILHLAAPVAAQEVTQASTPPVVKATYIEVERGLLVDARLAHGATGTYVVEIQRAGHDKAEFIRLPPGVRPPLDRIPAQPTSTAGASSAPEAGGDPSRAVLAGTPACIPGAPVR
jgi:hypothetical protein